MAEQYIFTMLGLNKFYGQKQVLKDINLCFYPGAKIGIVGENGSGKSTVLRIMAGLDPDFQGRAELSRGYTAGMVAQEPVLDPDKTVRQTIEAAFAGTLALLDEFNAVSMSMGELQDELDAADAWNLDQRLAQAGEPMPSRLSSIALGTGDIDCVYHFALYELLASLEGLGAEDALESLKIMMDGKRLKDISDLPMDLAV